MNSPIKPTKQHTYIIEHLDLDLEAWSTLEYRSIAIESRAANAQFLLTSVPQAFKVPAELKDVEGFQIEHGSVEELYPGEKKKEVCLLDPKAEKELSPGDGDVFGVFLFGGILGDDPPQGTIYSLTVFSFR